jgi:hypothetical protein
MHQIGMPRKNRAHLNGEFELAAVQFVVAEVEITYAIVPVQSVDYIPTPLIGNLTVGQIQVT